MENKNHRTSCPKAVCEKILRAITFNPAFTTIRRISSRQQQTPPPAKQVRTSDPSIKNKLTSPQATSEVPIKFDYTTPMPPPLTVAGEKGKVQGQGQVQVHNEQQQKQSKKQDQGKKGIHQYEENFTAYINKARKRIMSVEHENSPKMVGHGGFGKDHHFSDYIDQTKRKIRTTSSLKGRGESFSK